MRLKLIKSFVQRLSGDRIVWRDNNRQKTLRLTFDDGPNPVYTPMVMDILDRFQIKGVFFLVGKDVIQFPEIARQIVNRGHLVGNHSYSHRIELKKGITNFNDEIKRCNEAIFDATGISCRLFRPPWGIVTARLAFYCLYNGLQMLEWSFDSEDYKHEQNRGITGAESGDIILLHDDVPFALQILNNDIPILLDKGFTFIS